MFKDWWKELSEELIPDSIPDRFILVEQKPELDLEQEDTELDPVQIKRRRSNLEIITEMLNHKITEVTCCFSSYFSIYCIIFYSSVLNKIPFFTWYIIINKQYIRIKNQGTKSLPQHQICPIPTSLQPDSYISSLECDLTEFMVWKIYDIGLQRY